MNLEGAETGTEENVNLIKQETKDILLWVVVNQTSLEECDELPYLISVTREKTKRDGGTTSWELCK